MSTLRVLGRVTLFLWVTLALYSAYILARFLPGLRNNVALHRHIVRAWAKSCGAIIGMRTNLTGSPPSPPFILVSNHLSYVDILLILGRADGVFIAKNEVRHWPLIGFLARSVGTLFIDRQNRRDLLRVNSLVAQAIAAQKGVILFPEGTTSKGESLLPFKPSLLDFPAQQQIPTYYCTISYQTPPDAPGAQGAVCWWDDSPFFTHLLKLMRLHHFTATLTFGEGPVLANDRKILSRQLHQAMAGQWVPIDVERPD